MPATIGIQPSEVSHIISLARDRVSQKGSDVKPRFSISEINQQEKEQHRIRDKDRSSAAIDSWDGMSAKTFVVGNTSKPLRAIGIKDRKIIWHSGKISKILQKHSGTI